MELENIDIELTTGYSGFSLDMRDLFCRKSQRRILKEGRVPSLNFVNQG